MNEGYGARTLENIKRCVKDRHTLTREDFILDLQFWYAEARHVGHGPGYVAALIPEDVRDEVLRGA